jgi:hypothetical protein
MVAALQTIKLNDALILDLRDKRDLMLQRNKHTLKFQLTGNVLVGDVMFCAGFDGVHFRTVALR